MVELAVDEGLIQHLLQAALLRGKVSIWSSRRDMISK